MSSTAGRSPEFSQADADPAQPNQPGLKPPPPRPTLVSPPARPKSPAVPAAATTKTVSSAAKAQPPKPDIEVAPPPDPDQPRTQPIMPPTDPMQYRAIGLVYGRYEPEDEQLNRGRLTTEDGDVLDTVMLGRISSLVRNHIDLTTEHLWVVYPRTRDNPATRKVDLGLQIMGIWEPETLSKSEDNQSEGDGDEATPAVDPQPPHNYFSVRGEIVKYSEASQQILVEIVQQATAKKPERSFKLVVEGVLEGRTVGYFWSFDLKRDNGRLVVEKAVPVAAVPPKKRKPPQQQKKRGSSPRSKGLPPVVRRSHPGDPAGVSAADQPAPTEGSAG